MREWCWRRWWKDHRTLGFSQSWQSRSRSTKDIVQYNMQQHPWAKSILNSIQYERMYAYKGSVKHNLNKSIKENYSTWIRCCSKILGKFYIQSKYNMYSYQWKKVCNIINRALQFMKIQIDFMRINMPIKSRIFMPVDSNYADSLKFCQLKWKKAFLYLARNLFCFCLSIFAWVGLIKLCHQHNVQILTFKKTIPSKYKYFKVAPCHSLQNSN